MEIHAIIQARMTSTRLPGKVLMEICGRPLLDLQIERLRRSTRIGRIIVATTSGPRDDAVEAYCRRAGISVFRGSEDDVLGRYYVAARENGSETIVRLTADCPLLDARIVDKVIDAFLANECDYASNTLERTYPRGLDAEVFGFASLELANLEARSVFQREHVTPFLYQNPHRFRLYSVKNGVDLSHFRWTVDTDDDFRLVREIFTLLLPEKPLFEMDDVVRLMHARPELAAINSSVTQKG